MAETKESRAQKKAARPPAGSSDPATKRRWLRGGSLFAVGSVATFLMMANESQLPRGPLWGILAMLVAVIGLVDLLGLLVPTDRATDSVPLAATMLGRAEGEPVWMSPKITLPIAALIVVVLGPVFGYARLPWVLLAALLVLVLPALRRPSWLVFVLGSAIMLPALGAYGLWDPWETHYGEVGREILSRDDWISLWWAQEDWFWSKPILIFWANALSMGVFGHDYHPDAFNAHPEWALRFPVYVVCTIALLAVYAAVARVYGKRTGVVSALVLATMPHFFLLSHQAITDPYFVGLMTAAMCFFILALAEDADRPVLRYRFGPVAVSVQGLMLGLVAMLGLPQILYLASRNVTMVAPFKFAWHRDAFVFGSAGNGNVPGNKPLHDETPVVDHLLAQPMAQALYWALGLAALLWLIRREKSARGLAMFAFYVFCALAFMGKGIPGFALPGLVALFWLIATRRWSLLLGGQLKVAAGVLTVAVLALPWFVAMYMRHGPAFTDRLLVHDHLNRLASGVHGDTGTISYFIEQLGVAMFPWVALAPAALTAFLHFGVRTVQKLASPSPAATADAATPAATADAATPAATADAPATAETAPTPSADPAPSEAAAHALRSEVTTLVALWFVAGFVLFSAMITKFHHYIFPVVPPAAILIGLVVDRMLGRSAERLPLRERVLGTLAAALAPVALVLGVAGLFGDVRGAIDFDAVPTAAARQTWVLEHPWSLGLCLPLIALGIGFFALAYWLLVHRSAKLTGDASTLATGWRFYGATTALAAAPVLSAFVARDLGWVTATRPAGYERLIDLFVYNYAREWPNVYDYRPILIGFGVVATTLFAVAAVRVLRPVAARAVLGLAFLFAVWGLDVYLLDVSPHWAQNYVIGQYYARRHSAADPLVAWQMNWKGENFYTGNRVNVFVDLDNTKLRTWMTANAGKHAYVMLEHSRLPGFRSFAAPRVVHEVTGPKDNNKFLMVELDL
jgi:4-amino-4-deoxy-L-arabinose transferase-like glycosyltransferase